jgi:hypothetical protein
MGIPIIDVLESERRKLRDEVIATMGPEELEALRELIVTGQSNHVSLARTPFAHRTFRGHVELNETLRSVLEEWREAEKKKTQSALRTGLP